MGSVRRQFGGSFTMVTIVNCSTTPHLHCHIIIIIIIVVVVVVVVVVETTFICFVLYRNEISDESYCIVSCLVTARH